ncbi:MAG: DsbE family thiol:disulfide interchange protein [Acidiferrobacterales bacterium]
MTRYLVAAAVFVVVVVLLGIGLTLDPRRIPSPLIGKPMPAFELKTVLDQKRVLSRKDLVNKVSLFNVWASWCLACLQEHPILMEIARSGVVPIYGLNYKDKLPDAIAWLKKNGNPFVVSASDLDGRVGIEWGVYGVPETFVIDRKGMIRHKHIGPISMRQLETEIMPLVRKLKAEPASPEETAKLPGD